MLLKSIKIMILCVLPFMLMAEELSDEPMEGDFFIEWDFPECTSEQDKTEGCVKRSYHENGRPWYETLYTNGKKQGERGYYENGNLKFDTPYTDGVQEGVEKWYYEHGSIEREIPHKNGESYGVVKFYHKNGKFKKEYERGKVESVEKWYYENGNLEAEIPYKNYNMQGIVKMYMPDTRLLMSLVFEDHKILSGKCSNDKALNDEQLQRLKKSLQGLEKDAISYEDMAQMCGLKVALVKDFECKNEQDKIKGCVERMYYDNGNLQYEIPFKNGVKEGVEKWYYTEGNIMYEFPYTNGKKEGVEKYYFDYGGLKSETPYKNDKAEGISKEYYYENGGLETEFSYKNGKEDGITKVYMFNGKLLIAITYQEGKALSGICGNDKALSDEQLQSIANYYPLPQERIAQLCGMKLEVD